MSILALLTNADGSVTGPVVITANPDGTPPALINVRGFSGFYARGPLTVQVLGTSADWYTLTGPATAPGEQGSDADVAQPGRGSPGMANPGDPGSPPNAVTYAYSYVYSAPVLTPVGESNGST